MKYYRSEEWLKVANQLAVLIRTNKLGYGEFITETPKEYDTEICGVRVAINRDNNWFKIPREKKRMVPEYDFNRHCYTSLKKMHCTAKIYVRSNVAAKKILVKLICCYKAAGIGIWDAKCGCMYYIGNDFIMEPGVFDCNEKNQQILVQLVNKYYENDDVTMPEDFIDDRDFAFSPSTKKFFSKTRIDEMRQNIRGELSYQKFLKIYDPTKRAIDAVFAFRKEYGKSISESQIKRYIKRYKTEKNS